jgi:hypothetical protein
VDRDLEVTAVSAEALLKGLVDYAGLFPPAALPMDEAVWEYARWRRSDEAWMLGRFVLPADRLVDLARAADAHLPAAGESVPWRLSALLGPDVHGDSALVASFNRSRAGRAAVDTVELKAAEPDAVEAALDALPPGLTAYVELPLDAELEPLLGALSRRGARAKARTGGVVPEAIPGPDAVARFLVACARAGVPFKATAGLHHPVRAEQPLDHGEDAPRAVMHGFLNVFAASALAWAGAGATDVEALLREQAPRAFRFDPDGLRWREHLLPTATLAESRRSFASSFGSCSFAEPVVDLRALGVLA